MTGTNSAVKRERQGRGQILVGAEPEGKVFWLKDSRLRREALGKVPAILGECFWANMSHQSFKA